ncbi:hypothetical protein [Iamia sp.]|nr:hypothetical protein [Iamia sp.]HXH59213.1 hypothetical protein [Iamia sp.]
MAASPPTQPSSTLRAATKEMHVVADSVIARKLDGDRDADTEA